MGIVIRDFTSPEFWTAIGSAGKFFTHLTMMNFITDKRLIPVTISAFEVSLVVCWLGLTLLGRYLRENDHH